MITQDKRDEASFQKVKSTGQKTAICFIPVLIFLGIFSIVTFSAGVQYERIGGVGVLIILSIAGLLHTLVSLLILLGIKNIWVIVSYNLFFWICSLTMVYMGFGDQFLLIYPILAFFRVIYAVVEHGKRQYIAPDILDDGVFNEAK